MTAAADVAALELGAQRGGARRRIAWDALADVPAGDVRAFAGAEWLERMKQEHLAVGAFSRMAVELAEEGCDDVGLVLVARAAADEVRHAEVCRNVAVKLLDAGAVPRRLRGVPRIPEHPSAAPADRALYHVVEMCCLSETVTGVWFTEAIARATHPTMRAVLESLL
ncbi:MAG TPA: hypothetical protein VHB21_25050, partial [Minicystis sp.]|nr:hypothetical protein [Minicystis sp.]